MVKPRVVAVPETNTLDGGDGLIGLIAPPAASRIYATSPTITTAAMTMTTFLVVLDLGVGGLATAWDDPVLLLIVAA